MSSEIVKLCNKCKIEKSITEFYTRDSGKSYRGTCKQCLSKSNKEYHKLKSNTGYFVYRLIKNKVITYLGKTMDLERRLKEHKKERIFSYAEYIEFNTEVDMNICEYYFINRYKPIENKQDLESSEMMKIKQLDELAWTDYSLLDKVTQSKIEKEISKAYDQIEEAMIRIEKLKELSAEEKVNNRFKSLSVDREYKLEEVDLPIGYKNMKKTILAFTIEGDFIDEFASGAHVAKELNVDDGSVYRCCIGQRENHKGYLFRYNFI